MHTRMSRRLMIKVTINFSVHLPHGISAIILAISHSVAKTCNLFISIGLAVNATAKPTVPTPVREDSL